MASRLRWLIWTGLAVVLLVSLYNTSSPGQLTFPRIHVAQHLSAPSSPQGRATTAASLSESELKVGDTEGVDDLGEYQPYEPDSSFIPQTLLEAERNYTHAESYNDLYLPDLAEATTAPPPFSCPPKIPNRAKARIPLIVFTMEHAGSDLLFRLLRETALISSPSNSAKTNVRKGNNAKHQDSVHLMNMNELFASSTTLDHSDRLWIASTALAENCINRDLVQLKENLQSHWVSKKVTAKNPSETISFLRGLGTPSVTELVEIMHDRRLSDMVGAVKYIKQLPDCFAEQSVVAIKILDRHLYPNIDPSAFVANLHRRLNGKINFVILWRRRLIDAFIVDEKQRLERAGSKKSNSRSNTEGKNLTIHSQRLKETLIEVKRGELEQYMREKQEYFKALRDQFERLSIPYHVLEYERDMATREEAMRRIQQVMLWETSITSNKPASHKVLSTVPSRKKRSQSLPLHQQVSNWEQVSSWGYNKHDMDWPDLFSTSAEDEERAAQLVREEEERITKSLH